MNSPAKRLPSLDILRGLAVFLMFITHSRRIQIEPVDSNIFESALNQALNFFINIEPFTFALFLFVAGFSVGFPDLNKPRKVILHQSLIRTVKLSAISAALFLMDRGPQWPSLLISSGPLLVIALCTLTLTLIRFTKIPFGITLFVSLLALGFGSWLEQKQIYIEGLNRGNSALLNEFYFAALGALSAYAYRSQPQRKLFLSTAGGLALLGFIFSGPWTHQIASEFFAYGPDKTVVGWVRGIASVNSMPQSYGVLLWQYTALGCLRMTLPLLALVSISFLLFNDPRAYHRFLRPFETLGQRALFAYVFHLCVIGVLAVAPLWLPHAAITWIFVLCLMVFSVALPLEKWQSLRQNDRRS